MRRKTPPTYGVVPARTGFAVECREGRHVAYLGRDGLWVRDPRNTVGFIRPAANLRALDMAAAEEGVACINP